jgi:hypothetical protein
MARRILIIEAILSLNANAKCEVIGADIDDCQINWLEGTAEISKADIKTEMDRLQAEYDAQDYARNRKEEYPSIEELVVALYDTDDRTAIDEKRAAVKLKYPKP